MEKSLKINRTDVTAAIWDYILITFGVFLYTMAWSWMMIPNGIASGGLTSHLQ